MTTPEAIGGALKAIHFASLSIAVGAVLLANVIDRPGDHEATVHGRLAAARYGLILALVTIVGVLGEELVRVAGSASLSVSAAARFASQTWSGSVLGLRAALIALSLAVILAAPFRRQMTASLVLSAIALFLVPAGGHAVGFQPSAPTILLHGLHTLAAGIWFGGLSLIALEFSLLRNLPGGSRSAFPTLVRFSAIAMPLMLTAIASGSVAAYLHVEDGAHLFGTTYGAIVVLKAGILLAAVLAIAATMRRYIARGVDTSSLFAPLLRKELLAAAGIAICAGLLASIIPARHDVVTWLFPFRFAPATAWKTPGAFGWFVGGVAVLGLAVAVLAHETLTSSRRRASVQVALVAAALAGLMGVASSISVEAYPTTYEVSTARYDARSVIAGERIFHVHCTSCHGRSGRGDGPGLSDLPLQQRVNADLTGPHTGDHTAGDMFWLIGHGKPSTRMPAFGGTLSVKDRWLVIAFLRALSLGHQARLLSQDVVENEPWLPSIDIAAQTAEGDFTTLRGLRVGGSVLLVLIRSEKWLRRASELVENARECAVPQLHIMIVLPVTLSQGLSRELSSPAGEIAPTCVTIVDADSEDALAAWAQYRRTLDNPDWSNDGPCPGINEFLIDRFGYVRARWAEGAQATYTRIAELARELAKEPQIQPPAGEHVH